jgi:ferrous iron transport protein A
MTGADLESQMQLGGAAMMPQKLEIIGFRFWIRFNMQPDVKKTHHRAISQVARSPRNLNELLRGEEGVIERLDLPPEDAQRLMEMGFVPGHTVTPAHSAPGGDPRVFRVDGSEVALRRETARKLILKVETSEGRSET